MSNKDSLLLLATLTAPFIFNSTCCFAFLPPLPAKPIECITPNVLLHLNLHHEIHWLDSEAEEVSKEEEIPLGESIAEGECVLTIPNVFRNDECQLLFQAALQARERRDMAVARGRSRLSVADPNNFDNPNIVLTCEEILLRVIDYLEEAAPSIYETLFAPGPNWCEWQPLNAQLEQPSTSPDEELFDGLRELYVTSQLEWSEGEPAINIYEAEGYFGCHKDHLALTVLAPLLNPGESFSGGGTGFWVGNRDTGENPATPPTMVFKPPAGTALVFAAM